QPTEDQNILRRAGEVVRQILGAPPVAIEPLAERGTFHALYRVQRADQPAVILRVCTLNSAQRDFLLFLDPWAMRVMRSARLPSLQVLHVDLSRHLCGFDYALIEQARG